MNITSKGHGADFQSGSVLPEPENAPLPALREKYRPELDGIRAICIIFTIIHHIPNKYSWINGEAGVDIFFPLSGWLITSLLIKEFQINNSIDLVSFWIRRVFRIMPLYYLTAILYILLSIAGAKSNALEQLHSALAYMLTMCMEYRPASAGGLFGHAWTLGIEEKFYIVWPLILTFTIRYPLVAGLLSAASLGLLGVSLGISGMFLTGYAGLVSGSFLSMLAFSRQPVRDFLARPMACLLFLGLVVLAYVGSVIWNHSVLSNVLISSSSAMLISSLWFGGSAAVRFLLSVKPLPWLGRLTYAIYLLQSLCIRLTIVIFKKFEVNSNIIVIFTVAYTLSIALAAMVHIIIEKPMIRNGKKLASRYKINQRKAVV